MSPRVREGVNGVLAFREQKIHITTGLKWANLKVLRDTARAGGAHFKNRIIIDFDNIDTKEANPGN